MEDTSIPSNEIEIEDTTTPSSEFDDWFHVTHKTTRVEIREEPDDSDELDIDRLEYDEDY